MVGIVRFGRMPLPMKTFGLFQSGVVLLFITLFCGCASTGYKKSDAAAESLQDAAVQVQAESIAIDSTVATLNDLINNPASDLKPQFERYNEALGRLVALEDRNEKAASRASHKSVAYFDAWDKQLGNIEYESIRNKSLSRKGEVKDRFNTVNSRYHEAQQAVQPLISYFDDIRIALSTDLTAGGLESVKTIALNAEDAARKVQMALSHLSDELAASGTEMSSTLPSHNQNTPSAEARGASEPAPESQHAEAKQ
jgi:hypothetical protein